MSDSCPICTSLDAGNDQGEILRLREFRIRRHPSPSPIAGWTIVDIVRHAATLDELSGDEAAELGRLVARTVGAIRAATGCDRVYVLSFAEAARHVHVHLAPRHEADPRTAGWAIADLYRAVAAGEIPAADEAACAEASRAIGDALGDR